VIDLPAIAAPVDRNHRAKDNERSLSGSIDKVRRQPAGPLPRQRENEQAQVALTGEQALTAALVMLMLRKELRAGDCLKVRPNELANLS
jgi:hypothetical protein